MAGVVILQRGEVGTIVRHEASTITNERSSGQPPPLTAPLCTIPPPPPFPPPPPPKKKKKKKKKKIYFCSPPPSPSSTSRRPGRHADDAITEVGIVRVDAAPTAWGRRPHGVVDAGRSGNPHPSGDPGAHRHHQRDGPRRTRFDDLAPGLYGGSRAASWSRTTRASTTASCATSSSAPASASRRERCAR